MIKDSGKIEMKKAAPRCAGARAVAPEFKSESCRLNQGHQSHCEFEQTKPAPERAQLAEMTNSAPGRCPRVLLGLTQRHRCVLHVGHRAGCEFAPVCPECMGEKMVSTGGAVDRVECPACGPESRAQLAEMFASVPLQSSVSSDWSRKCGEVVPGLFSLCVRPRGHAGGCSVQFDAPKPAVESRDLGAEPTPKTSILRADSVNAPEPPIPMPPIQMLLSCPTCAQRHVDEGEFSTKPHHTHACQNCGHVWRPAIEATVGVRFLPGFKNGVE